MLTIAEHIADFTGGGTMFHAATTHQTKDIEQQIPMFHTEAHGSIIEHLSTCVDYREIEGCSCSIDDYGLPCCESDYGWNYKPKSKRF